MIRNRLSDLLGERQIKISKLSLMTGIARSTLTPIYFNHSEMIKIDTINNICRTLNIDVSEFFESVNFDINFNYDEDSLEDIFTYINYSDEMISNYKIDIPSICHIKEQNSQFYFNLKFISTEDTILDDSIVYVGDNNKRKDVWHEPDSKLCYKIAFENTEDQEIFYNYIEKLSVGMKLLLKNKIINFIREALQVKFKDYDENQYFEQPKQKINKVLKKSRINIEDNLLGD